jgi:hypothetical protein
MDGSAFSRPQICYWEACGQKGCKAVSTQSPQRRRPAWAYMQEFVRIMREVSFATLKGIKQI